MTDVIEDRGVLNNNESQTPEKPLFADITLSPQQIMEHMPPQFAAEIKALLDGQSRGEQVTFPENYYRTKYGIETVVRAKRVLKTLISALYRDVPFKITVTREQDDSEIGGSHDYDPKEGHVFTLETSAPPSRAVNQDERPQVLLPNEHTLVNPRMLDLIKMIHEYAHAIYEENANKDHVADDPTTEYASLSGVLNEGFTTFMETMSCENLIQNAQEYGLSKADIVDLKNIQNEIQARLATYVKDFNTPGLKGYMKTAAFYNLAYSEGYDFIKRLHQARGLAGLTEFIQRIDINKVKQTRRGGGEYLTAFKDIDAMSALALSSPEQN